jgi:hypothetical protein
LVETTDLPDLSPDYIHMISLVRTNNRDTQRVLGILLHAGAICSVCETKFVSKDRLVIVAEKSSFVERCSNLHILAAISYLTRSSIFVSDPQSTGL